MRKLRVTLEEYLNAVGQITVNAAAVEQLMASAFTVLVKCTPKVSTSIFYTLDSIHARETLLHRILECVGDSEDSLLVKKIIACAKISNNQRKKYAHAYLIFKREDTELDFNVVNPKNRNVTLPYRKDINNAKEHMSSAWEDASQAFHDLCDKHQVPRTAAL
jgi:hypothetical protein